MSLELKRVPMDFDYKNKVWYGHYLGILTCLGDTHCEECKEMARIKNIPILDYGCPDWNKYLEEPMKKLKELLDVPTGEGYQLWEIIPEESPISPVFKTLDELCEWCEENIATSDNSKISKKEWEKMFFNGMILSKNIS